MIPPEAQQAMYESVWDATIKYLLPILILVTVVSVARLIIHNTIVDAKRTVRNAKKKQNTNKTANSTDPAKPIYASQDFCPRCGGELVVRTAQKGPHAGEQFYGCSNFPHCRYTQKFD